MPPNAVTRQIVRLMAAALRAGEAGDHETAEATWWRCFEIDDGQDSMARGIVPDLPPLRLRAYLNYAEYRRERGNVIGAIEILESARDRWPDDPDLPLFLAYCHEAREDWAQLAAAFERSLELRPRAGLCLLIGRANDKLGRHDEALRWLHHSFTIDPDYAESHYNLACVYERDGDLDAAVTHFRRAIELDVDYALAHARLGQLLHKRAMREHRGDFTHACWIGGREHLARATMLAPDDGWSHAYLGLVYEAEERFADAETHFQAATRLLPEVGMVWSIYGHLLLARGDAEQADRLHRHAVSLDPEAPEVRFAFGRYLWNAGKYADARTELRLADRLGDPRARAWLQKREAERRRG